ncbi:DUF2993 domain-containing protein [Streptomyces sp. NPDC046275]|uniref:LmeA family phospholipid-binding protein n=1 Tax=Streptomyces sp. NPDC046275 TaxID=3157201 RepID=UPI00340B643E
MGRRWVKVLLIVFGILAALFVAVDRIAVHYAEKEAVALAEEKYGYGAGSTDGFTELSIHGFPFLTQAASLTFDHVTLTAGNFSINTTANAQGDHLGIRRIELDLHDLSAPSVTARRVDANLVTGRVTIGYEELSGVLSRLTARGGALTVAQGTAPAGDSGPTLAPLRVTGTQDGRKLETAASISVAADEFEFRVPELAAQPYTWRVPLPQNVNITAVRATADGVEFELTGHQVVLGR